MRKLVAVALVLAAGPFAMGDVLHQLVVVPNDVTPGSDPFHGDFNDGTYFSYDLQVIITDIFDPPGPDDWTSALAEAWTCLLYTSPSPRDRTRSRMPSSA